MPVTDDKGAFPGHSTFEYLNLSGDFQNPVWTRITRTEDVDLPDSRGGNDFKIKGSGFTRNIRGVRTKTIGFKYRRKRGTDLIFAELKAAYEGDDMCVDYTAVDRDITLDGANGFRGPFNVEKFDESRPFEGVVEVDVLLKFADAEHPVDAPDPWEIEPVLISVP